MNKRLEQKLESPEAMIRGHMSAEEGEAVCELCASPRPREELITVWIGRGSQEEGLDVCRSCKEGGAR